MDNEELLTLPEKPKKSE